MKYMRNFSKSAIDFLFTPFPDIVEYFWLIFALIISLSSARNICSARKSIVVKIIYAVGNRYSKVSIEKKMLGIH